MTYIYAASIVDDYNEILMIFLCRQYVKVCHADRHYVVCTYVCT